MDLYRVEFAVSGQETVYVLASNKEEARKLADEEFDQSDVDLETEVHVADVTLPPWTPAARLASWLEKADLVSEGEEYLSVGEWWSEGGPTIRERGLGPAEAARRYREEVEAAGQQRLFQEGPLGGPIPELVPGRCTPLPIIRSEEELSGVDIPLMEGGPR